MQSLIVKDLLNLKKYFKTLSILILFYTVLIFTMDDFSFLSSIITILFLMIPMSSFSYDEHAHWDLYAQSLPITRKEIVASKYIASFGFLLFGACLSIVINLLSSLIKNSGIPLGEILWLSTEVFFISILLIVIIIPIIYKFGVIGSRFLLIFIFAIPTLTLSFFPDLFSNLVVSIEKMVLITSVLVVIGSIISFVLSLRIYERKEF